MLEFWFNHTIPTHRKLFFLTTAIILAYIFYQFSPMPYPLIALFIGAGIIFLICRFCKTYITSNNPKNLLYRVFTWIPLAFLCAVIFTHATQNLLDWGIQGILQMIITICVFSPQALFQKK
ncbi:hypothetical protein [Acinetobacter nectaris]|uniref:hypothetical protein n=1 Tax=Acinetobacter nectaris TaxID=1219382 RepID=UPI001F48DE05|nr:hypothetical protein [Acinetobacter nectaris]MCF9033454.1 hypothetical protein [Acinetobacter nectaris]